MTKPKNVNIIVFQNKIMKSAFTAIRNHIAGDFNKFFQVCHWQAC
jgi:hypothetical protein